MASGGPTIRLTFSGDADQLAREAKRAEQATLGVGESALGSSRDMERAAGSTNSLGDRMSNLGNMVDGASTAIGDAAGTLQAFADISDAARQKQMRMERALNDVAQAQEDYNQAVMDGKQATQDATQSAIDARQAQLDYTTAQLDYNTAVKEYGVNSLEAEQASIDLLQAEADVNQARIDGEQAIRDGEQAAIDARGAQLDLNEAQSEANPSTLQEWAGNLEMVAPLLQGLIGILGFVTLAQWAWNAAQLASPTTWIVLAILALVGVIIYIATQTTWFQDIWKAAWDGIKGAASAAWDFIKQIPGWIGSAFRSIGDAITAPFRAAFAGVKNLWNSTVGGFGFTIPGWVPFVGGNSFRLPRMHVGGVVGGAQGQETMAILQAGERVIPRNQAGGGGATTINFTGNTSDALATVIMQMIRTGRIQIA